MLKKSFSLMLLLSLMCAALLTGTASATTKSSCKLEVIDSDDINIEIATDNYEYRAIHRLDIPVTVTNSTGQTMDVVFTLSADANADTNVDVYIWYGLDGMVPTAGSPEYGPAELTDNGQYIVGHDRRCDPNPAWDAYSYTILVRKRPRWPKRVYAQSLLYRTVLTGIDGH